MDSIIGISAKRDISKVGTHVRIDRWTEDLHGGFVTKVIGLQFSGNASGRQKLDTMGVKVSFPATVEMPCGWSVIIPTLEGCCHDLECPCGNSDHWIIKWERQYETLPQDPDHLPSRPSYKIQDAPAG